MATEADIEMVETFTPKNFDDRSSTQESKSEDDDKDKDVSIGDRNDVHKSDRKIGHRRVGVGGEITYKKVPTTQIMGSIQLGIQHAVGGLASKPERDLLMQDFMTVETTNFPHEGSNHTPAHHYSEFKFKTYAPIAFRYFRDLFGIQPDDFLMSMCSSPLRELSNPGASGSIFYLTEDDEFIIKTVQHKEGEFLQKLLPGYYMNLNQNPRTLLPKFFGLYCYQCNSKNVRLVAMNNLLPSVVKLHQKYDLKGSTYKRKASKSERIKKSPTYKDLDFMEHHPQGLFLEADTHGALVKTIQRDCRVLESFKIMDYSLLVGVHNLDKAQREKAEELAKEAEGKVEEEGAAGERSMLTRTRSEQKTKEDFSNQVRRTQSINRQRLVAHSTAMESIQAESEPIDEEEDVPPGGIPARNEKGERLLLFVGVIDILQSYRFRKKLEHTWKSMIHDGDTVSVHRPNFYAQRFQDFMAKKVFMKIPSPLKHSPSKRKSISRPLRQQEDLETSGAASSSGISSTRAASPPEVDTSSMDGKSAPPYPGFLKTVKQAQQSQQSQQDKQLLQNPQRVPPPVPPRGSPKVKRGGSSGQPSPKGPPPSCGSTPPPPFEDAVPRGRNQNQHRPAGSSRTDSASTTSSSASVSMARKGRGDSHSIMTPAATSTCSVLTASSASSIAAGNSSCGDVRGVCWTPPASTEGSTPTWTEGTPSFTESSSSGDQGILSTPVRMGGVPPAVGRRRDPPPQSLSNNISGSSTTTSTVVNVNSSSATSVDINCLTSEMTHL